jgi:hypothetical protein
VLVAVLFIASAILRFLFSYSHIFYTFYRIIKSIIELDEIFQKCPKTTEEYYVYRGIDFKDQQLEENMLNKLRKLKKGDIFSF